MRNPGTDYHRRQLDADQTDILIARRKQQERNAAEWKRRAIAASLRGDFVIAQNCYRQAGYCLGTAAFPRSVRLSQGPSVPWQGLGATLYAV